MPKLAMSIIGISIFYTPILSTMIPVANAVKTLGKVKIMNKIPYCA
jgi:hypothetical protein